MRKKPFTGILFVGSPGGSLAMLLAVSLVPFACALVLFAYFFERSGEQDTPEIADAMRQINHAQIIPFPEPTPEQSKSFAAGA